MQILLGIVFGLWGLAMALALLLPAAAMAQVTPTEAQLKVVMAAAEVVVGTQVLVGEQVHLAKVITAQQVMFVR